ASMLACRSGWVALMPVSSTATVAVLVGWIMPNTASQPIFGRAHWLPYRGAEGIPSTRRFLFTSAFWTCGSAWYFFRMASTAVAGTSMMCKRRAGIEDFFVPPLRAMAAAWSAAERPLTTLTSRDKVAGGSGCVVDPWAMTLATLLPTITTTARK